MSITLIKISAGDVQKIPQFWWIKNALNAQAIILTSNFQLRTVKNVHLSKFTTKNQNNANALLRKNILQENNALLVSTPNSLIFLIKLASIAQINKSTTLKSKNVFHVLKISHSFKTISASSVQPTPITISQDLNVNLVLWEGFTTKKSKNVFAHQKNNIGLEISVSHASIQDTLIPKSENVFFAPTTKFMMWVRKNVLTVLLRCLSSMENNVFHAKMDSFITIWPEFARAVLWEEFTVQQRKNVYVQPISFGLNILAFHVCIRIISTTWQKCAHHAHGTKFTTLCNKNV